MNGKIQPGKILLICLLLLQYCRDTSGMSHSDTRHRDASPFKAYGDNTDVESSHNYKTNGDDDDDDDGPLSVTFTTCMARVNEGKINLRKLSGDKGIPRFVTEYKNWTYTFDPCMSFNLPQDPNDGFGDKCRYVTVCKSKTTFKRSYYYALGTMEHSQIENIYFPHLGKHHLGISYRGMKSHRDRSVHIALICDANRTLPTEAVFTIVRDAPKKDTYGELRHGCACLNGCTKNKEERQRNDSTSKSRDDDESEKSSLNDTTLTVLILIVVGLLMIAMLIGGLCYKNTTSFKPYQKISGRANKPAPRVAQLDYEPRQTQSKKKVLPILDCCVIPASKLITGHRLGGGIYADTYVGKYGDWTISVKRLTLVIHQNQLTAPVIEWMKKEVGYFGKQRHRNIVSVLGLCLETRLPSLITEFIDGVSVKEFMRSSYKSMTWPTRARICLQAADGLAFLHSCKPPIFHRDVRCANIFITDQDIVKVSDFGVTKLLQPLREECRKEECVCQKAYSACASSVRWTAPEVLRNPTAGENDQKYSVLCDVYSFGITMWELAHNRDPYPDLDTEEEVATCILNGAHPKIAETIEIQPEYLFLMNHCWDSEPAKRPKFKDVAGKCKEILHHSRAFQKQIMHKVQYDPEQDAL